MAGGSDTSISYDINIDLGTPVNDKFPKNLIFYYDGNYENAIYKEDNKINLKGFLDYENSLQDSINIYWKWAYETGITEQEKTDNNTADNLWIGKPVSISASVTGKQEGENSLTGNYQVTFDANGGVFPEYGYNDTVTKNVTVGDNYGNLPVPVREGYTFLRWNSKNLLDSVLYSGYYIEGKIRNTNTNVYKSTDLTPELTSGSYVISCNNNIKLIRLYIFNENINKTTGDDLPATFELTSNSKVGFSFRNIESSQTIWNFGNDTLSAEIQLEKGSTPTDYEPSQIIASNSKVTQNKNHTLTAIWEEE